jgi:fluoride ion exporter CrcB/FEX
MNICQFPPGVLGIFSLAMGIFWVKPWVLPSNRRQKIIRSGIMGITTVLSSLSLIETFVVSEAAGNCINAYLNSGLQLFTCIVIPFGFIAAIGQYFQFTQMAWLSPLKNKIIRKQKDK